MFSHQKIKNLVALLKICKLTTRDVNIIYNNYNTSDHNVISEAVVGNINVLNK